VSRLTTRLAPGKWLTLNLRFTLMGQPAVDDGWHEEPSDR
jgi:hypothetical protein